MFQEMMPMSSGGGDSLFNAVSGDGTATAGEILTISTGLDEIHQFVILTFVDGATYDTFAVTAYDVDAYSDKQLAYGYYGGQNYSALGNVPMSGAIANGVPSAIHSVGYDGVAGDVRIRYSDQGSGSYKWFAI